MRALCLTVLTVLTALGALTACSGGGGPGAACDGPADCDGSLQCLNQVCIARCERASQCGDGYACRLDGICVEARGALGNSCSSETDCAAGLACTLDAADVDQDGALQATCAQDRSGHAFGASCTADSQCRNGTCALGRCVDLCTFDRDCPVDTACMRMPRVEAEGAAFRGCLPEKGLITWDIPVTAPTADVLIPVPQEARGLSLTMTVDDESQLVGASYLTTPSGGSTGGRVLYNRTLDYFQNLIRHRAANGVSVIQIPSSSASQIVPGAYRLSLSSLRPNGAIGSATPRLRATVAIDKKSTSQSDEQKRTLHLHFHFVDFTDYPCKSKFGLGGHLNAALAKSSVFDGYVDSLRSLLSPDVMLAAPTYDDLSSKNVRDNIGPEHLRALLAKGLYATGVNVFFVRSLSPSGSRAIGPTPGTVGIRGTAASGIVVSLEQLCYGQWEDVARTTAHQLARYMGLFPNVDSTGHLDPIDDSGPETTNLMFFSDQGGTTLTKGQRDVLAGSPVLQ